jgi:hypothetical protein
MALECSKYFVYEVRNIQILDIVHNEERSLYRLINIVRVIKSGRLRWAGHVARKQEGKSAFKILIG